MNETLGSHVRVELTGHGAGKVWINGKRILCQGISIDAAADRTNRVRITLVPDMIELVCNEADVERYYIAG